MLVLLDIDGVMVPAHSWKTPELLGDGFPAFSEKAVRSLKKIISETGASILLTTSHKSRFDETFWMTIFAQRGIQAKVKKLDSNNFKSRKDEVMAWVEQQGKYNNYIIIDDDKSLNDLPPEIKQKLILTSSLVGLTEESAATAIAILNRNEHLYRA